jgi:hypothetical protein
VDSNTNEEASPSRAQRSAGIKKVRRVRTELEVLEDISGKLDRITAVLAAQGKERDKQIDILSAGGCDSALIGTIVGITAGAVRTHRSRTRGSNTDGSGTDESESSGQVDD